MSLPKRNGRVMYNAGDSLKGESVEAKARRIDKKSIVRQHKGRSEKNSSFFLANDYLTLDTNGLPLI